VSTVLLFLCDPTTLVLEDKGALLLPEHLLLFTLLPLTQLLLFLPGLPNKRLRALTAVNSGPTLFPQSVYDVVATYRAFVTT
jgi:hypothetical protein